MKYIFGKKEELEKQAVKVIARFLKERVADYGAAVLGIPGGRSVQGVFEKLKSSDIPWDKVQVFMVDERSDGSNSEGVSFVNVLPKKNFHPLKYENGAGAYGAELDKFGGGFDLVLLGVGEDGHVASLFPEHDSVRGESAGFIEVEGAPKAPADRISASVSLLRKSGAAVVLFFGKGKKQAYQNFRNQDIPVEKCPIKLVMDIKNLYIFTDQK